MAVMCLCAVIMSTLCYRAPHRSLCWNRGEILPSPKLPRCVMLWCGMVSAESWITLVSYIFCNTADFCQPEKYSEQYIMSRETQEGQELDVIGSDVVQQSWCPESCILYLFYLCVKAQNFSLVVSPFAARFYSSTDQIMFFLLISTVQNKAEAYNLTWSIFNILCRYVHILFFSLLKNCRPID